MNDIATEEMTRFFDAEFCDPVSESFLSIQRISDAKEILPGTIFEFEVNHDDAHGCVARVYCGLSHNVSQRLWLQEAQSLVRLSSVRHPSLPRIVEAKFLDSVQIGVIVSQFSGQVLTLEDLCDLRAKPQLLLRYFSLAADALRVIHARGLIHRDIWRESFEFVTDDAGKRRLRLIGFEMSAFAASLSDPAWRTDPQERGVLQLYRTRGGTERRACRAPEVLAGEAGSSAAGISFRSDIFSVGVCGYQWFIGDIPAEVAESQERAAVAQWVSAQLSRASELPAALRQLLRDMVSVAPANRPTATDVINRLGQAENAAFTAAPKTTSGAYVVSIAPVLISQYVQVPLWLPLPDNERALFHYLRDLIIRDLEEAVLIHRPEGAVDIVTGGDPLTQAASQWVLIGRVAVYFCQPFTAPAGGVGHMQERPWVLHASYIVDRGAKNLRDIGNVPLRRTIPRVRVVHHREAPEVREGADERMRLPPWSPLLDDVHITQEMTNDHVEIRKGYEWWMHVRRAQIENEVYAYRRTADNSSGTGQRTYRLTYDEDRDRQWVYDDSLRDLLAGTRRGRPAFRDFFATLFERGHSENVRWLRDRDGRPDWESGYDSGLGVVNVKASRPGEIVVDVTQGSPPPAVGWLRPSDGGAEDTLLARQTAAAAAFYSQPDLMNALYRPYSFPGPRARWQSAGKGLQGNARFIVEEMLSYFPFYALQGPPGTGKTTVVTAAVSAYLKQYAGARILISAQSHFALDELAERIVKAAQISSTSDIVAVRAKSEHSKPRPSMERYFDAVQADDRVNAIEKRLQTLVNEPAWASLRGRKIIGLVAEWARVARNNLWEIQDRIWRSANIVFATTGACTQRLIGSEPFDWVIVEEAAKAWSPELIMPLVLGYRWTLVGDHKQLPPFGEETIQNVYETCLASRNPLVRNLVSETPSFRSTLNVFEWLFTAPKEARRRPLNTLDLQFRMDDRIFRVVKQTFYRETPNLDSASHLKSETSLHGLTQPSYVHDRALVWLDTGETCRYEKPHWSNEGEVGVVSRLVDLLQAAMKRDGKPLSLIALSPYHHQNDLLRIRMSGDLVQTTDSFQGREADIVIVSLVRTNGVSVDQPLSRIGHVASAPRANVLLSRAKKLLVIVGDFTHFSSTTGSVWEDIGKHVRTYGAVVRA